MLEGEKPFLFLVEYLSVLHYKKKEGERGQVDFDPREMRSLGSALGGLQRPPEDRAVHRFEYHPKRRRTLGHRKQYDVLLLEGALTHRSEKKT